MLEVITKEVIQKYDTPGPRYTSYPTAPEWTSEVTSQSYLDKLQKFGQNSNTLSLYLHIPFCQSMCYFCGCNVVIRKQEDTYGNEYINYIEKELNLISRAIGSKKQIRQLHWGGGTPTFLNEAQIERLFKLITIHFDIDPSAEVAIEIDPRTIDQSKVKKLRELGFNRVSMGVQDFDPDVQQQINRIQSYQMVADFHTWCRELGFQSVNYDLIYGLPGQSMEKFSQTLKQVAALKPDRIALYSFAYVPWLKKHQTKFAETDLPSNDEKLDIFLNSRQYLMKSGYEPIAMDHFALQSDELARAFNSGKLYRNFMGYTVKPADEYLGVGVSAIGFVEKAFIQNLKALPDYYAALNRGEFPVERGKVLSFDDQIRQWVIGQLMCHFAIDKFRFFTKFEVEFDHYFKEEKDHLAKCEEEQLITITPQKIQATGLGKIFIRNVCMGFDWYLRQKNAHKRFSRTV